jgi:hypothetical protein
VPLSRGCGSVPHSPREHSDPSFFLHSCRPSTLALIPILDLPILLFFWAPSLARLLVERTPSLSPLLFLTQARIESTPWTTLTPPRDPPVIPFHSAFTSQCAAPPPPFTSYKMPPCPPLLHPTPRSEVELVVSISLRQRSRWRSSGSSREGSSWRQSYKI